MAIYADFNSDLLIEFVRWVFPQTKTRNKLECVWCFCCTNTFKCTNGIHFGDLKEEHFQLFLFIFGLFLVNN